MEDINQINVISTSLKKEKDGYSLELYNLNIAIEKKISSIAKMISYQGEYSHSANFSLSKSVPALIKNLFSFSKKVSDVISQTENEIDKLKVKRNHLLAKIVTIENKIKLMEMFAEKIKLADNYKQNIQAQSLSDEANILKQFRSEHD